MLVYLVSTAYGLFALDENSRVLIEMWTYPDIEKSIQELSQLNQGETTDMLGEMVNRVRALNPEAVVVEQPEMARALTNTGLETRLETVSLPIKWFRTALVDQLVNAKTAGPECDTKRFLKQVAVGLAQQTITRASEERDILTKQAIDAIDELDKAINIIAMRTREWFSMYQPALDRLVEDNEVFSRLVTNVRTSENVDLDALREMGLTAELADAVVSSSVSGTGGTLSEQDLEAIRTLAETVENMYRSRRRLEEYIQTMMKSIAPNITALVGPVVGARLISLAGSLKDLAARPSSTVQVLGAERALFRSLKTGTDPPKHGVIFQVADINAAPYWQRGRIARALAGKLSIAARIDAFSKRDMGEELRLSFQRRVEEIRRQNPEAPPPRPTKRGEPRRTYRRGRGFGKPSGRGGRRH
ncbi:MAG: C/D box methylation guide ribonucleoprotein complex aNOP56 subunit [Candidatus Thorarchaeota archaeon]|nr:C/D box methylation guide ribonucleoprotein complex aNOP56 subunit [Candidatus Thorarchaeota archaeon]